MERIYLFLSTQPSSTPTCGGTCPFLVSCCSSFPLCSCASLIFLHTLSCRHPVMWWQSRPSPRRTWPRARTCWGRKSRSSRWDGLNYEWWWRDKRGNWGWMLTSFIPGANGVASWQCCGTSGLQGEWCNASVQDEAEILCWICTLYKTVKQT